MCIAGAGSEWWDLQALLAHACFHTSAVSQYLHQAWLMNKMDLLLKAANSVIYMGGVRVDEAGVIALHRIIMSFSCLGGSLAM